MGRHQEGKSPPINHIWPHHKSMARTMVAGGLTPKQLAVAFGYSRGMISRIIQSPLFVAELDRLTRGAEVDAMDMHESLRLMGTRSLEVMDEDLHAEPTDTRQRYLRNKTARDVLDRIGLRKDVAQGPSHLHLHKHQHDVKNMTAEELREDVMEMVRASEDIED